MLINTLAKRFFKTSIKHLPFKNYLKLSPQVQHALHHNIPIVALESTIISHGMPYPQNYQCALEIQKIIRDKHVVPATIALFDGKIHIGLNQKLLERLSVEGAQHKVKKTSRKDIAYCLAEKITGATTVSGTMICSNMVGIDIFVTGGIGGVHRGVEQTMDISADLTQLGRTPVAVVCAGVKSILDIGKTLQYLETEGVPVATLRSQYFPAFYSASSGLKSPLNLQTEKEIARLIKTNRQLHLNNGILIGLPNPEQAQSGLIQQAIQQSLIEMAERKIKGFEVTPFLLKRVNQKTKGQSLKSNIALIKNNANIGAQIAIEYKSLINDEIKNITVVRQKSLISAHPIVIGGSAMDTFMSPLPHQELVQSRSNSGKVHNSMGGVARNVAEVLGRLDANPIFITPLGNDEAGQEIKKYMKSVNVKIYQIKSEQYPTARFMNVIKGNGDMLLGISDMQINKILTFDAVYEAYFKNHRIQRNTIVSIDSNMQVQEMNKLVNYLNEQGAIIFYECIAHKSTRIIQSGCLDLISVYKMNHIEQDIVSKYAIQHNVDIKKLVGTKTKSQIYREVIVTRGEEGISHYHVQDGVIKEKKYPIVKAKVIKTLGAGDTVTGTIITALSKQKDFDEAIKLGICASKINIETPIGKSTISDRLNLNDIYRVKKENQF